jgi:hypothetical protein
MTSGIREDGERLLKWTLASSAGAASAFVVFALVWGWPLQTVATGFQSLGVVLSLLGVGVVRGWLARTHRATVKALAATKGRIQRSWGRRREQLRHWWARKRGKTISAIITAGAASATAGGGGATVTVGHARVDRDAVSDREWLAWLDDRVELILQRLDQGDKARSAVHEDLVRRLGGQRDELRAEMDHATQQGWELIVSGLAYSAIGTVLGGWV